MRFLLDDLPYILLDDLPYSLKVWLEDRGGGALKLFEVGFAGADDEEVYQYALENRFAVITLDLDFGYLFLKFRKGTIIVLRPSKATPSKIINLVKNCMENKRERRANHC